MRNLSLWLTNLACGRICIWKTILVQKFILSIEMFFPDMLGSILQKCQLSLSELSTGKQAISKTKSSFSLQTESGKFPMICTTCTYFTKKRKWKLIHMSNSLIQPQCTHISKYQLYIINISSIYWSIEYMYIKKWKKGWNKIWNL